MSSAGIEAVFTSTPEATIEAIKARATHLVLIDCDNNDTDSIREALSAIRDRAERPPVILLSMGGDKSRLIELIRGYDISNLVAKHGAVRAVYPMVDEHELLVTCEKVLRRDIFGIDKYIGLWGVVLHSSLITSFDGLHRFLEQFQSYIARLDLPTNVIPRIVSVAEELISNAMIHAPVDADGQPKYEHLPRSGDLRLEPGETVDASFGCDGQRLMLSVTDNFGRLHQDTVYKYLDSSFQQQLLSPESKPSGAGLGLSLSFDTIHQMVFNIQENRRTEAIAGWYVRINSTAEFRRVEKSLNIFWLPQDSVPASVHLMPTELPAGGEVVARTSVVVEESKEKSTISLRGRIDGDTDFALAREAAVLDLRGVSSFNSPGVVAWLSYLRSMRGRSLRLRACPPSLISQSSLVAGMVEGVEIESVLAPFACGSCGVEEDIEMRLESVLNSRERLCDACDSPLEFVGFVDEYRALSNQVGSASSAGPDPETRPKPKPEPKSTPKSEPAQPATSTAPSSAPARSASPLMIGVIAAIIIAVSATIYVLLSTT